SSITRRVFQTHSQNRASCVLMPMLIIEATQSFQLNQRHVAWQNKNGRFTAFQACPRGHYRVSSAALLGLEHEGRCGCPQLFFDGTPNFVGLISNDDVNLAWL